MLVVVALVSGGGVYLWQQGEINKHKISPTPAPTPTPTAQAKLSASNLVAIDNTWNLYTNNNFGFSLKVPKVVAGVTHGNCVTAYTVPTVIFDDLTGIYLTVEHFLEYAVNNVCQKTTNTLSLTDTRANQWRNGGANDKIVPSNWHFIFASVSDDTTLDQFIKSNWGTGCKLGSKTMSTNGHYDVKIAGDGLDLDQTKCPINFMVAVKYSPELKKAVTWSMGQSVSFSSPDLKQAYDEEIANSFKFTK